MEDFSFVTNAHPSYIEAIYNDYLKNPQDVNPEFRSFFEGFDFAFDKGGASDGGGVNNEQLTKEFAVFNLINAYRKRGHLVADINPLLKRENALSNLELSNFGLTDADLNTNFAAGKFIGKENASLKDIVEWLKSVYTGKVAIEYYYLNQPEAHNWCREHFEKLSQTIFTPEQKKRILSKVSDGVHFEKFLGMKFIGQKRFGLEGGESLIPALDFIVNNGAELGVKEVTIGMAHRGRLSVLHNIMGKNADAILSEFVGQMPGDPALGSGDVKYHLGFRNEIETEKGKKVRMELLPNPSHLETVNPVVAGYSRARVDNDYNGDYNALLPILIHGDAAIAGQGILYEVLQMSKLNGYKNGGIIHYVINNQIGFTTDKTDARSSDYSTSLASTVQAPVLHVNGDDPESVVRAAIFAIDYRQKFQEDVFIDMVCFRRNGHNEGDEPRFTQPQMYQLIDKHTNVRDIYVSFLKENGTADADNLAEQIRAAFWDSWQADLDRVKDNPLPYTIQKPEEVWAKIRKATPADFKESVDTSIPESELKDLFNKLMAWPEGFTPLKKIVKLLNDKIALFDKEQKIDWATGELLAYATIVANGHNVRLSGEDVQRGTFSHRHAILHEETATTTYNRLSKLGDKQGTFTAYNSLLSEYGVLGFDYGYSMAYPDNLVIWEAQYGDFANGAQIIMDQYLSGAEEKWAVQNGLVLLLPHGYEGSGPEHSSARLERYLQMCAENNMYITNITTAANFFHALRRQVATEYRKPLVNFSPKANLRHVRSYSSAEEFTNGKFQEVIDDAFIKDTSKVKRVLLCTGKVYFDLSEKQITENREDVAILRLEQIHPLPQEQLIALYQKYSGAQWLWVQEEPRNMGAAAFLKMNLTGLNIGYLTRQASAATATGFAKKHIQEQNSLIEEAFTIK